MNPGTWQLSPELLAILSDLIASGLFNLLLDWYRNRHKDEAETQKTQAETRKTEVETSGFIIDQLQEILQGERQQHDKKLEEERQEREKLQARVETLEQDNKNLWEQVRLALKRVGELEAEVADWKKKYHELLERYRRLIAWIRKQGLTPPTEEAHEPD